MIDYKKHKSNFSPYLEKLYQSDKPMVIHKYKDGYKIFTDFSKRIVLNNSNIENFLNNITKKKFRREQALYIGFFSYELLCNLLNFRIKNQSITIKEEGYTNLIIGSNYEINVNLDKMHFFNSETLADSLLILNLPHRKHIHFNTLVVISIK